MNTQDISIMLKTVFAQDTRNQVILLLGPPGLGKTALVGQAAKAVNKTLRNIALPTCESVDLRGIPYTDNGATKWASPMPKSGSGVLLLDELSSAPPDVQAAAHHIVWAEAGSDMSLAAGWHLVLTGNRAADKTLFRAASGPLRNRLTIINAEYDNKQWCQWAMDNSIRPEVVGFIRWRPELLFSKEIPTDGAFPSGRAWQSASDILNLSVSAGIEREMIAGTVGEGPTTEFSAYLRTYRELPAIESIMARPSKAEVPKSPSLLYALVTALAQYTREKQVSAMPYIMRIPAEFGLLYVRDIRDKFDIATDPSIREWIAKHKVMFTEEQ